MKISFIINSIAKGVDNLVGELENHPEPLIKEADIYLTKHKGHALQIAQDKAHKSDVLVIVGGDGTINEVVNGIMHLDLTVEDRPRLALIPKGSGNDFARIQNIPADINSLLEGLKRNMFRKVDVGRIIFSNKNQMHYFINVADSGMGAEVVKRLEGKSIFRKILSSNLRFALAIFMTFLTYKRKKVEILINDHSIGGRILTLIVANSSAFGSGLIIAPDARIDDGRFQLVVGDISLFGYLASIRKLLGGEKIKRGKVQYHEASKIKIYGPSNLLTEADGELAGAGDLEISCLPGAIEFFITNSTIE